jgi:hypothetical protein
VNYGGTGSVMHNLFPTTTEGSEGSLAFDFPNNTGAERIGTVVASCTLSAAADPIYRGEGDDLPTHAVVDLTAKCPNARQVSGGGTFMSTEAYKTNLVHSYPVDDGDADKAPDDGWKVRVWSRQSPDGFATAYAVCTNSPGIVYRRKRVNVPVDKNVQPFVACREDRPALSAGFRISGFEDRSILNALEIYDGGDDDLAPDDGAQARVANILTEKTAKVYAICKR